MPKFKLNTPFQATGDQPQAIEALVQGVLKGEKHQTLKGVTGSGKTFTMANVIARLEKPTLVMAPNKTLAAQLYSEFKEFFPENSVEYFVSYYDYYQPEAYIPNRDLFIEKDSSINEEIDKLRHGATYALFERNDLIIVASVSCIYGLGSPEAYQGMLLFLERGKEYNRDDIIRELVRIHFERSDYDFHRGTFRARGDVVEIFPAHEEEHAVRLDFFGDELEAIYEFDPITGAVKNDLEKVAIYPASHFVTQEKVLKNALVNIKSELEERIQYFHNNNLPIEKHRIEQRTKYDLELMQEIGFCKGIENYSRHLTGREAGQPPPTLIDFFPDDFLLIVDESHVTVPQIGGMYRGDRARKTNLVEHGFRLPSALDNRPLKFEEFEKLIPRSIYVSATPGEYELTHSGKHIIEQIIRPTGLVDPVIEILPVKNQVDTLIERCQERIAKKERILVTTLTKKMAEDLSKYLSEIGIKVRYLHSDIDNIERVEIIRDLRLGTFDVLVGINLLREGLDLPEVSLVAILDADKEGFLRSTRSLIQTCGRAARNINGHVIMFADHITDSMARTIDETNRRRALQMEYNKEHGIIPKGVVKKIKDILPRSQSENEKQILENQNEEIDLRQIPKLIAKLKKEMQAFAKNLDFEKAAELRDQIAQLRKREVMET